MIAYFAHKSMFVEEKIYIQFYKRVFKRHQAIKPHTYTNVWTKKTAEKMDLIRKWRLQINCNLFYSHIQSNMVFVLSLNILSAY